MTRGHLFVTCTAGLESALAGELKELGFKGRQVVGGFETDGDWKAIALHSRIAGEIRSRGKALTGELYRRGYREEIGRAPMRETLAAGVLRLAGYRGHEPLWDPMCGSGTLLIEAALIVSIPLTAARADWLSSSIDAVNCPWACSASARLSLRTLARAACRLSTVCRCVAPSCAIKPCSVDTCVTASLSARWLVAA